MDFLKNLAKGVYNTVNKVGSAIGNAFSGSSSSNIAGVAGFNNPSSYTPVPTGTGQYGPGSSYTPVVNGKAVNYTPYNGSTVNSSNPTASTVASVIQNQGGYGAGTTMTPVVNGQAVNYTPAPTQITPYEVGSYRSALPGLTDGRQDTRFSTRTEGVPYYNEKGNLITPKTGFFGLEGGGTSYAQSTPMMTQTGANGNVGSGGSNFTGTLQGTSGQGTPAVSTQEDDKMVNGRRQDPNTRVITTTNGDVPAPILPSSGLVPPNAQLASNVPGTFDMGQLDSIAGSLDTLINNPSAFNSNDFQNISQNIDQAFNLAYNKYSQLNPNLEQGVKNSPEQDAAVQSASDPYGYQQQIDQLKMGDQQLMQFETQRNDLQNQVQAITDTYKQVIDDIKADTSLPAGIKQKRLDYILDANKGRLEGVMNAIKILDQDIEVRNNNINRQLGIAKLIQDDRQRASTENMSRLKLLIDSGAVGALSDSALSSWASATGMSVSDLKAIKNSTRDPNAKVYNSTNDNGDVTVYQVGGDGKVKTLATLKGIGNKQTSGSGTSTLNAALQAPASALQKLAASFGGKVPAGAYSAIYQQFSATNPALGKEFLTNFPIQQWLDPKDWGLYQN